MHDLNPPPPPTPVLGTFLFLDKLVIFWVSGLQEFSYHVNSMAMYFELGGGGGGELRVEPDADMWTHWQPSANFYILAPQTHTVLENETLNL